MLDNDGFEHTGRKGIEHLTVLFPTVVSSFDFQVENSGRTIQYKLNAKSLRLFGLHSDVNDAHRAGANRLQNTKHWYSNPDEGDESDQTDFRWKTEFDLKKIDATRCEFVGSRQGVPFP